MLLRKNVMFQKIVFKSLQVSNCYVNVFLKSTHIQNTSAVAFKSIIVVNTWFKATPMAQDNLKQSGRELVQHTTFS